MLSLRIDADENSSALAGFILCLSPLSNVLLGWRGAGGLGAAEVYVEALDSFVTCFPASPQSLVIYSLHASLADPTQHELNFLYAFPLRVPTDNHTGVPITS